MFGLPGLKNLNAYFKIYRQKQFQKISLISKINSSNIAYCPIIAGINFLDQITNLEKMDEVGFENMSYPFALFSFPINEINFFFFEKFTLTLEVD